MIREAAPGTAARNANTLLILLFLAYVCSGLDRLILPLMVGPVRQSLNINDFQISLLQGVAFGLCYAFAGLPLGRLADRANRIWLLAGGILLWTMMTIACGLASSFGMLFVARMGLGLCEATLAPAGYSLIADSFSRRHLVRANAVFASGALVSIGFSYLVAGLVISYLSSEPAPFTIPGLAPWQLTFIVIGAPGLILVPLFLLLREPPRGDRLPSKGVKEVVRYLWGRRRDYAPFYAGSVLLGVPTYAGMNWFPAHMIRFFHMDPKSTGVLVGSIQLAGGVCGTFLGAWLTERFVKKGRTDAHLRTIACVSVLMIIGMCGPLIANRTVALSVWFVAVLAFSGYFSSAMGALQIMTPSNMRGVNTSLIMMASVLGGQVAGTAIVGALADNLFPGNDAGIGRSLAITGLVAAVASLLIASRGMPRFAEIMRREENSLS